MILIDSSVWIDFFRGIETEETMRARSLLGIEEILAGDLIVAEVLQGFPSDRNFLIARELMSSLTPVNLCGWDIAVQAAHNFRWLRAKGITVRKTIDTLIATWCIENGKALLTSDRDFEPFFEHLGLARA